MSGGASADEGEAAPQAPDVPEHLASLGQNSHVHFEKDSVSGGKFWETWADGQELRISWGKLSANGQMKVWPRDQCLNHNPLAELTSRALKKKKEGYRLISGHI